MFKKEKNNEMKPTLIISYECTSLHHHTYINQSDSSLHMKWNLPKILQSDSEEKGLRRWDIIKGCHHQRNQTFRSLEDKVQNEEITDLQRELDMICLIESRSKRHTKSRKNSRKKIEDRNLISQNQNETEKWKTKLLQDSQKTSMNHEPSITWVHQSRWCHGCATDENQFPVEGY